MYSWPPVSFGVTLIESNITIAFEQDEQPSDPNEPFTCSITLNERSLHHLTAGPVTREQMDGHFRSDLRGIYMLTIGLRLHQ